MKSEFEVNGYYLVEHALEMQEVESLIQELSAFEGKINSFGVRGLMGKIPAVHQLAHSSLLLTIAREILGEKAQPIRSVFFDKLPGANWNVPWHQDTSVALNAKHAAAGFGPWSEKQGVVHAEPPEEYLKNILTLRVHLDTANKDSGVLRVVPGTHRDGRVMSATLIDTVANSEVIECDAAPGDVLLMSPLLFHSSRKATNPSHRRIIHIEYSAMELPAPLEWNECA